GGQIAPLPAVVNGVRNAPGGPPAKSPPLAAVPERGDGEDLARQLDGLEKDVAAGGKSLSELARLREQAAALSDRAAWVGDAGARKHLLDRAAKLLQRIGA